MQSIWEDARTGKLTEKRLLDHMMEDPDSLDGPDTTGTTPLGHALKASKASVVELLMKNTADPDTLSEGLTPTYLAVIAPDNSERLLQLLLGRNPKTLDTPVPLKKDETPLMAAITVARNPRLVKQLVEAGASLDKTNGDGKSARSLVDLLPEEEKKETLDAGVFIHYVSANELAVLREPVAAGGTIVIQAPFMIDDVPRNRAEAGIDLMYLDSSTGDASDEESFDVPLQMTVNRVDRAIECKSKQAYRGYQGRTTLKPQPWLGQQNLTLSVEIGEDEFVVYANGRKTGRVRRAIKAPITHVNYWTLFAGMAPIMGDRLTVTTYRDSSLVP
ncbi:hypothetical protein BJX68DRAFT_268889 [Aspergillus pseudodeflectus]|uniref:Ankyrin repeat-containing domain protein n=1 Tax=Aspergillus pseudodeflectus TaxID=176178 RepID=A0ABR4K213_9EURO